MRSLRAFEAAARHGSFSSAAEELGTTQSVVSRNIAGLERQLAVRLFERLHRGVRALSQFENKSLRFSDHRHSEPLRSSWSYAAST